MEIILTRDLKDFLFMCGTVKYIKNNTTQLKPEELLRLLLSSRETDRILPFVCVDKTKVVGCMVLTVAETPLDKHLWIYFMWTEPHRHDVRPLFMEKANEVARGLSLKKIKVAMTQKCERVAKKENWKEVCKVFEKEVKQNERRI